MRYNGLMSTQVRRLYEQFQPSSYQLSLKPDAEAIRFTGTLRLTVLKNGRPSQRITLHQKGLTISKATIVKHDKNIDSDIAVVRINLQKSYDEVRLHTDEMIYPGKYTLEFEFSGAITEPMHGLYPCYFEINGQKKKLLATQFESHHAREVFPCIDEPEAKATFDLTLETPAGQAVLANTPVKNSRELNGDISESVFETTPVMSTYLLAFVIGDMHCSEAKTKDGVVMRTWGTVAQPKDSLEYANKEAVKILEFFTDYFQTPFPLKKCDQVALPDFESGAMENWGLITYREIALLADPHNRSLTSEQYVSMVVAHELSHQWFGNLVTMKWWDNLWLNESFASLMEHIALDNLHPDWAQWEQYTSSDVIASSNRDIFKDVQAVQVEVNHPDEIGTLFDPAIVYAKGGRLLKMMLDYIGEEAFRLALKSYFKKHAYKNTVGEDLWTEMSVASGKDIGAFMQPWISQSGMPVLSITHEADTIKLTQKRFVLDATNDTQLWPVPLLADQELEQDILSEQGTSIARPSNNAVIFNKNGSGHMLTYYTDESSRKYIAKAFATQALEPASRINLLNDLSLLARRGDAPLTDSYDIIREAKAEPRDAVWMMMSRAISTGLTLTEGDMQAEKNIKEFRRQLVSDWYQKLGWNDKKDESANDIALRQTILSMTVASEDNDAIAESKKRYHSTQSVENLPAEQRAVIVGTVVKSGEDVVDNLIEQYNSSHNPDVQLSIASGLTSIKDSAKGKYILERALGENGFVRPQDIFRWYAYMMRNQYTRDATWEWLKTSWGRLEELFGDSKSFEYFVAYSATPINTSDWQKSFDEFFTPKEDVVALRRNILIARSEIEARVAWRNREESRIKQYFQ